ncbi:hypothetical protein TSOC_008514 [Tetrabaena socialis]|uniref:60S ribosomal protein L41 n=1 Tax=Tetrabaena socialis TaxID=47790 RepID=A0A2J7ZY89_9CHLO|nr:hypothetical protein TSOC_008514 [Tetrabaena socialis]|eukprot:PNH05241.1 hypothetical protein TSOC_008514 [Tetrabaena socialis]
MVCAAPHPTATTLYDSRPVTWPGGPVPPPPGLRARRPNWPLSSKPAVYSSESAAEWGRGTISLGVPWRKKRMRRLKRKRRKMRQRSK